MTQAPTADTITLQIVACETCDMLFLVSPRRETCPTCGGPPGVEFFTFDATPEGVHLVSAISDAGEEPPGPETLPDNGLPAGDLAPVDQWPELDDDLGGDVRYRVTYKIGEFLYGGSVEEEEIDERFLALGADPDASATAVGRLRAVRDLLAELIAPGEQPGAAGPEDVPAPTPETEASPAEETGAHAPAGEPDDVPGAQTLTESPSPGS